MLRSRFRLVTGSTRQVCMLEHDKPPKVRISPVEFRRGYLIIFVVVERKSG
jgi:hypothetical protein